MDLAVRGYSLCGVVWYRTLKVKVKHVVDKGTFECKERALVGSNRYSQSITFHVCVITGIEQIKEN